MSKLISQKGMKPYLAAAFFNMFVMSGHLVLLAQIFHRLVTGMSIFWILLGGVVLIALPFVVLFSLSGMLADHFDKARVQRWSAISLLALSLWLLVCHASGWLWVSYCSILLLSIERCISAPSRSGYIKQCYGKISIAQGNALYVCVSGMALLVAIVVFSWSYSAVLAEHSSSILDFTAKGLTKASKPATILLVVGSILQLFFVYRIPEASKLDNDAVSGIKPWLIAPSLKNDLCSLKKSPVAVACLSGVMSFWFTSIILFVVFPHYVLDQNIYISSLGYSEIIIASLIGLILGSLYAGRLSRLFIESGYVVIAALGLTLILLLLPWMRHQGAIIAVFFIYGFCGGLLLVPLNALVQFGVDTPHIGRINSVVSAVLHLLIVVSVLLAVLALYYDITVIIALRLIFVIALVVAVSTLFLVPQGLVRYVIYFVAARFFKIDVYGLENMPSKGPLLMIGNHTSYVDWAIIQMATPRPVRFVMSHDVYEKWYLKAILKAFNIIPIGKTIDKVSIQLIVDALENGEAVALFPEGYLSRNGQLGTFNKDFEQVLSQVTTDVCVLPFYIRGLWGSAASCATDRYKAISKIKTRNVSLYLGETVPTAITAKEIKKVVFELSILSWKRYAESLGSLQHNWLHTAKRMANELCVADSAGLQLSHHKFIVAVLLVAKRLKKLLLGQNNIGLMLPTSAAGAIANMSVLTLGKTVVNLNYTAGVDAVVSAISAANIKTIVSAHIFVKKLKSRGIDWDAMVGDTKIIYLEDIKKQNSTRVALRFLLYVKLLPCFILDLLFMKNVPGDKTAAIMFSSGSEGKPKGVELSHSNLTSNIKQVMSVFNIEDTDTFVSILPLFHCFGLTVNALLPLISGATFVCHPDPTDAVAIGRMVYRYNATILCGSSTFFGLYVRSPKLHYLMFRSLRMSIAGAEKLSPKVRQAFKDKFFVDMMEGYGTTEVAPVASCNLPDTLSDLDWHVHVSNKIGSVGLPLPGSAFRILDPDTLEILEQGKEGMIAVGGPQVMKGYLNDPNKTNQVLVTDDTISWYLTGDKGYLDSEGYLFIVDRYSRFAKIGGEMVSLAVVEEGVMSAMDDPDSDVMAVSLADDKKGERIAVLYQSSLDVDSVRSMVGSSTMAKIMTPSFYYQVEELPKLASGKKDYVSAKRIAMELLGR